MLGVFRAPISLMREKKKRGWKRIPSRANQISIKELKQVNKCEIVQYVLILLMSAYLERERDGEASILGKI